MRLVTLLGMLFGLTGATSAADPARAINDPHGYAWELFSTINQPIEGDPRGRVAWEGWANARQVFDNPVTLPPWEEITEEDIDFDEMERQPLQQLIARAVSQTGNATDQAGGILPQFDPISAEGQRNETRLNRDTFEFIRGHNLFNIEGQERFFNEGRSIDFPVDAKEIKAQWRRIADEQAGEYHAIRAEDGQLWGLTALHITTKDLPNWFWATFEHKNNEGHSAVVPSVDPHGLPPSLEGTKWENYILRGTQIDFVDSIGRPTILANSQIESGFQQTSSCISCHARASIGPRVADGANRLSIFAQREPLIGSIGAPSPDLFADVSTNPPTRRYTQLDFVWSLFRAKRISDAEPTPTGEPAIDRPMELAVSNNAVSALLESKATEDLRRFVAGSMVIDEQHTAASEGVGEFQTANAIRTAQPGIRLRLSTDSDSDLQDVVRSIRGSGIDVANTNDLTGMIETGAVGRRSLEQLLQRDDVLLVEQMPEMHLADGFIPFNIDARDTHQVTELQSNHSVTGKKVTIGVWDGGKTRTTHREFAIIDDSGVVQSRRASQRDSAVKLSTHATHVAGTIGAHGRQADAKGMAPQVNLVCHDWNSDTSEMVGAVTNDAVVCSNHSYGPVRGWLLEDSDPDPNVTKLRWRWFGLHDETEDSQFGKYTGSARGFDLVVQNNPTLSIFAAAGNDRNDQPPPPGIKHEHFVPFLGWTESSDSHLADGWQDGGFDTIAGHAIAKNVITVGAINDITVDPPLPQHVSVTNFSCWGPCDDGRIKPDVVANGSGLFSLSSASDTDYTSLNGTSMACPTATGIGALLAELYETKFSRKIRADEMKAALIHTAMRAGDAPDYRIGWGAIRADLAGDLIAGSLGRLKTMTTTDMPLSEKLNADGSEAIRVTVVWIDPAGTVNSAGLDEDTRSLVHDIDVTLTGPDGTHFPWSLNPSTPTMPATNQSKNSVDNVERIDVPKDSVTAGQWTIKVTAPSSGITFAIAVSGLND